MPGGGGGRYRPFADIDHAFPMLRCGPSKPPFVHCAAFLRVKRRSAGQSPVRFLGSNDRCIGMPMGASELVKVEDLGQAGPTWVIQDLF